MLETIDLSLRLERKEYRQRLQRGQIQLRRLAYRLYQEQRPLVGVFEGWDAAGKGGCIRRLTEKIDPRGYQVYSIAKPEGDDAQHHYLWRFWRRLLPPEEKQIVIFDRSWYGRVLVERVEGFASEEEWKRAYREINQFERQLTDSGVLLAKLWLHISPEEQLRRFEARKETPHKRWKITEEDWRNRDRWDSYQRAVEDMLIKTSTLSAPWTVVEAEQKWHARVKVLETLVGLLEQELGDG
jgi:polyphosphate kinase 2 (PPK2 family)